MILKMALMAIGFAVIFSVWYFIKHRKPKKSTSSRIVENTKQTATAPALPKDESPADFVDSLVEVPARIYDNATRTVKNAMLDATSVRKIRQTYGNLGRRWFRDGEWRYAIVRLMSGECIPLQQFMVLSLKNPPERLHRALQQEETESFYKPRDNRSALAKYGPYLLFAGVVIVILFLWGANMMQGN